VKARILDLAGLPKDLYLVKGYMDCVMIGDRFDSPVLWEAGVFERSKDAKLWAKSMESWVMQNIDFDYPREPRTVCEEDKDLENFINEFVDTIKSIEYTVQKVQLKTCNFITMKGSSR